MHVARGAARLALDRPHRDAFDEVFLEERIGDHNRQNTHHRDGHTDRRRRNIGDLGTGDAVGRQELDAGVDGIQDVLDAVQLRIIQIIQTVLPVVPVSDGRHHAHRRQNRLGQWDNDNPKDHKFRRTIHPGGFKQLRRQAEPEIVLNQDDVECTHHQVRYDQGKQGVLDMQHGSVDQVGRYQSTAEEHGQDDHEIQYFTAGKLFLAEHIGQHRGQDQIDRRTDDGDGDRDAIGPEDRFGFVQDILVSTQRPLLRKVGIAVEHCGLVVREGCHHQQNKGQQCRQRKDGQDEMGSELPPFLFFRYHIIASLSKIMRSLCSISAPGH